MGRRAGRKPLPGYALIWRPHKRSGFAERQRWFGVSRTGRKGGSTECQTTGRHLWRPWGRASMPSMGDSHEAAAARSQSRGRRTKAVAGTLWGGARWLVSMPLRHFPSDEIGKNAALIGSLFEAMKRRPDRAAGLRVTDGRSFDLEATAFE